MVFPYSVQARVPQYYLQLGHNHFFHILSSSLFIVILPFDIIQYSIMVQVVSWPVSQASPREIYGGQSGTATGVLASTSVFLCQYHYTNDIIHSLPVLYCLCS
jgi:hypothetical protein